MPTPSIWTTLERTWLKISVRKVTMPIGRLFEARIAITVLRPDSTSPGRTGTNQRTRLMPGEPRLTKPWALKLLVNRPIAIALTCQLDAVNDPK